MNVPKLRFKDDDGRPFPEWESNLLGSYAEAISSGKSNARNGNGRYILYGSTGSIGYADDYDYQGEKLLIARVGANAGYLYRVEGDYCVSDNTLMLTLKQPHNYSFFFNLLTKKNLNKLVFGSGQPLITGGHLKNLEVSVPSLPEQTKIANFLTAVDEKVTQLTQKSDLLAQYKKGVMQKIFSQALRFKDDDGREFPEWKEHFLGDIATFFNGRAYKQTEWEDHGTPVIRLQNLTGSGDKYYYSNIKLPENQYCNKGDLLYMWSATFGPVWWQGDKAIYHYHIWKIETNENSLTKNYLFYVLDDITAKMKRTSNGSTMDHITKGGMEKLSVILPTIGEQTKIANFLIAIDDKITQTQAVLATMKQYKQGLLQLMFV